MEGFLLAQSLRVESPIVFEVQWQGCEAAGSLAPKVRKEEEAKADAKLSSLCPLYLVWSPSSRNGATHIQGGTPHIK